MRSFKSISTLKILKQSWLCRMKTSPSPNPQTEDVHISGSDEIKVYGPYDIEKVQPGSPYITVVFDKFKAKITNSDTDLDLSRYLNNELTGQVYLFADLHLKPSVALQWVKNTRSRSSKEKGLQFDEIIREGRKLFTNHQERDFSMRELAKNCHMTVGNLYAYVECKRDLWYAIILHDFQRLEDQLNQIIHKKRGNFKQIILQLARDFIQFARDDYRRHKMLFFTPVPPPKIDPKTNLAVITEYEEQFHKISILENLIGIIRDEAEIGGLKVDDPVKFAYFLFGFVQGNIVAGADYIYFTERPSETYDSFVIEQLGAIIDRFT